MAGKSTFLRTSGVNLVLALTGAPVFATEYSCPIINLRSGMRTADSLKDHQSYFYAELNRLKSIMDELRSDKPLFILLDEILKGTNSTDKQSGSIALLKQLLPHPCLAMIATHDIVLGEGGSDALEGGNGQDELWGGSGSDSLRGGDGNDYLNGEAGEDSGRGEGGIDTCIAESVRQCEG